VQTGQAKGGPVLSGGAESVGGVVLVARSGLDFLETPSIEGLRRGKKRSSDKILCERSVNRGLRCFKAQMERRTELEGTDWDCSSMGKPESEGNHGSSDM
jgi:hypothetical protein